MCYFFLAGQVFFSKNASIVLFLYIPKSSFKRDITIENQFSKRKPGISRSFLSHKDLMGAAETRACYSIDRGLLEFTYTGLFLVRFITSHFHNYKKLKIKFINFRMCLFLILSGDQG